MLSITDMQSNQWIQYIIIISVRIQRKHTLSDATKFRGGGAVPLVARIGIYGLLRCVLQQYGTCASKTR